MSKKVYFFGHWVFFMFSKKNTGHFNLVMLKLNYKIEKADV